MRNLIRFFQILVMCALVVAQCLGDHLPPVTGLIATIYGKDRILSWDKYKTDKSVSYSVERPGPGGTTVVVIETQWLNCTISDIRNGEEFKVVAMVGEDRKRAKAALITPARPAYEKRFKPDVTAIGKNFIRLKWSEAQEIDELKMNDLVEIRKDGDHNWAIADYKLTFTTDKGKTSIWTAIKDIFKKPDKNIAKRHYTATVQHLTPATLYELRIKGRLNKYTRLVSEPVLEYTANMPVWPIVLCKVPPNVTITWRRVNTSREVLKYELCRIDGGTETIINTNNITKIKDVIKPGHKLIYTMRLTFKNGQKYETPLSDAIIWDAKTNKCIREP